MAMKTDDYANQRHAAQTVRDRLVAEQADVRAKLAAPTRAGDAARTIRLRRREAELPERVFAAKVLAEQCAIAELEAELVGPRDDYDEAIAGCAREKPTGDGATVGWKRARDRLLRASGRVDRLERGLGEHARELAALLARAQTVEPRCPPETWNPEEASATATAAQAPCAHPAIEGREVLYQGMHSSGWACPSCGQRAAGESHHRSWCRADFCGAEPRRDEGPRWPLPAFDPRAVASGGPGGEKGPS